MAGEAGALLRRRERALAAVAHARLGYSLPVVYLAWAFVVIAMYPLCRWFAALKQRRSDWWLSYV